MMKGRWMDGYERPIIYLVRGKLKPFLYVRESSWVLSLDVEMEQKKGFLSSLLWSWIFPFNSALNILSYFTAFSVFLCSLCILR